MKLGVASVRVDVTPVRSPRTPREPAQASPSDVFTLHFEVVEPVGSMSSEGARGALASASGPEREVKVVFDVFIKLYVGNKAASASVRKTPGCSLSQTRTPAGMEQMLSGARRRGGRELGVEGGVQEKFRHLKQREQLCHVQGSVR